MRRQNGGSPRTDRWPVFGGSDSQLPMHVDLFSLWLRNAMTFCAVKCK
jgi:hypothetical protein